MQLVAIDYETHLISAEAPIPAPVCLSYYDGTNQGLLLKQHIHPFLKALLEDNNTILIAHNAVFELQVTANTYPDLLPLIQKKLENKQIICTKVYEQLIACQEQHPLNSFSLAVLVKKYFKEDISENKTDPNAWRLRYSELDNTPLTDWPKEAVDYAINDSIWAYRCYKTQEIVTVDYAPVVEAEFWLNQVGKFGMTIDQGRVQHLKKEIKEKLKPEYEKLLKLGLVEVHPKKKYMQKKMGKFRQYLQDNLDKKDHIETAKGNFSTTAESMNKYLALTNNEKVKEVLTAFLNIAEYEKILTAFVSRLNGAELIRTDYRGAVSTCRTSSSSSKLYPSVNIQQMPREVKGVTYDIRNCFKAREGYKLVSIDYSGLELASTAHRLSTLTNRRNMQQVINGGQEPTDMHSRFAVQLKNIKEKSSLRYDEFVSRKKEPGFKEYRTYAKPINLGFPGGIGYDTMRTLMARDNIYPKFLLLEVARKEEYLKYKMQILRGQGLDVRIRRSKFYEYQLVYDELVGLKKALFSLYPDLEFFLTDFHLNFTTGKQKAIKNEFGEWEKEPMYSYEVCGFKRNWCTYTAFCNGTLMQTPSAIGAKLATVNIIKKYWNDKRVNILAFIHDEIVLEVFDNDEKYFIIKDISELMIDGMQKILSSVRIAVEAEICGTHWRKAGGEWSKQFWKDANKTILMEK